MGDGRCQLLIGARPETGAQLSAMLERAPISHRVVDDLAALSSEVSDAIVVDLALEEADAIVRRVLDEVPDLPVVLIADADQVGQAVRTVREGASDFVRMPLVEDEVIYVVGKALRRADICAAEPPGRLGTTILGQSILGQSEVMKATLNKLNRAARGVATVLVRGESGTGKELVARRLHASSPRRGGPFVKLHCGALPDNLLESELFGYEKGAFTGATARKPGRLELAEGGTLFLDEIGDISPMMQVKLLRVLQDREYERLGGTKPLKANVRFVAATHKDLERMVKEGEYREDLFYRLDVVRLHVPPLRDRQDDIAVLARRFVSDAAAANGRGPMRIDDEAIAVLERHDWPGNVRQLQNLIERLVVLSEADTIRASDVSGELDDARPRGPHALSVAAPTVSPDRPITVEELEVALRIAERRALEKSLQRAEGNRNAAARILGVSRRKLYYMLQDHDLS